MPKYTFSRSSIVEELFTVEADTEEEALDLVWDGDPCVSIEQGEWIDWYHEEYHLESVEDELVTFLNSKEQACATI